MCINLKQNDHFLSFSPSFLDTCWNWVGRRIVGQTTTRWKLKAIKMSRYLWLWDFVLWPHHIPTRPPTIYSPSYRQADIRKAAMICSKVCRWFTELKPKKQEKRNQNITPQNCQCLIEKSRRRTIYFTSPSLIQWPH